MNSLTLQSKVEYGFSRCNRSAEILVGNSGKPLSFTCWRSQRRSAVTLVELLAVVGIITILIGLILPAVQAARESARAVYCANNLRQIGIAILNAESGHKTLPGGGWGFTWVGDPNRGYGHRQPGGWVSQVLPYMERDLVGGEPSKLRSNLKVFHAQFACPSSPVSQLGPYLGTVPLRNCPVPQLSFKADYAACGGARTLRSLPGPESDSGPVLNQYVWSHRDFANGLFFQGSAIRIAQITDGLSTTYMVGEKCVSTELAVHADDRDFGNDQAALIGDDHDVRRVASVRPYRSSHHRSPESFGSFHSGGWFALYADGSVSEMSFEIDLKIHQSRAGRDDGHASQL